MRAESDSLLRFHRSPAATSLVDGIMRRAVLAVFSKIERGSVTLVDGDNRQRFGDASTGPSVTVTVRNAAAYRAIVVGGSVGAGEAFMRGRWTCDDLPGLTRVLARNLAALDGMDAGATGLVRRVCEPFLAAARRNTRTGSQKNIAHHYDLSNEFFGLFLDESMMYSSAVFETEDATLAQAQVAKLDRICRRLDLRPEDHVLEIGTGWGALAMHAARNYGCRVTTATISREQHRFATERVRAASLDGKIEILLSDYRDLEGQYDKLVSVEMIEAVGAEYLDDYFRVCSERLKPNGAMLLQAITIADQHHDKHRASVDFIKEYIFPGSCLPSVTSIVNAATRVTDLRLSMLEDLTPHYARTLRVWRERFLSRGEDVRRLGFDDAFLRMWEYYLAYCEGGFEERYLGCVQMLFAKPGARVALALPRFA